MRDLPSQFQPKSKKHNCNLKTGGVNENVRQRVALSSEIQKSKSLDSQVSCLWAQSDTVYFRLTQVSPV